MEWLRKNWKIAVICAVLCLIVLGSVVDGGRMRQTAAGYLDLARGWAAAYQRDTAATRTAYEARIKVLTGERDALRRKYDAARGRMDAEWKAPAGAKELEERFAIKGFRGRVR